MIQQSPPQNRDEEISAEIELFPNELDHDAIGLWHIVGAAEGRLQLSGDERLDFVRRVTLGLLNAGAVPVRGGASVGYEWVRQSQYGTTHTDVVDAIIAEWLSLPDDPMVLAGAGVWFARPAPGENYVKMD